VEEMGSGAKLISCVYLSLTDPFTHMCKAVLAKDFVYPMAVL